MQYFIGIDLHKTNAFWTVKDETRRLIWQGEVPVEEQRTRETFRRIIEKRKAIAALEPVCAWRLYAGWLSREGGDVKVAAPLKVKAIAYNKLKNDRVDSEILCDLLIAGYLPEATLPSPAQAELAQLLTLRTFLVQQRAKLKQKARELLLQENVTVRRCNIFGKKARMELTGLSLSGPLLDALGSILHIGSGLDHELRELDGHLAVAYGADETHRLLRSIPGVGLITALTMQAAVGDWERFRTPGELASFAGLVPSSADSGGKIRRGRITKRGSRLLRAMLYEAAMHVNPSWGHLWEFFQRVQAKKGKRCARVALCRKMLTVAWYLVKRGESFVPQPRQNNNRPDLVRSLAPLPEAVRID